MFDHFWTIIRRRDASGIAKMPGICYDVQRAAAVHTSTTRRLIVTGHRVDVGGIASQR